MNRTTGTERTDISTIAEVAYHGAVDPVLVVSTDGVVLEANDHAREAFGDDIVGTAFGVPSTTDGHAEIELRTSRGLRIAEMLTGRAVLDGELVHVTTMRDVTERKRIEQNLRDFVSTASHEFRTPLQAISGFGETLDLYWDDLADEKRREHVRTMLRQARRLSRLTDDLLALSRIDEGALAPSPAVVGCRVLIERSLDPVEATVEVDVPDGLEVFADEDHVEDVLVNLLTNAVKYGAAPIAVSARADGDEVVLRVVDHGPGVPTEFRERMFERFSRERRAARSQPGSGLGLAIAKARVEANGGSLRYEETPGGGATFVVRLRSTA